MSRGFCVYCYKTINSLNKSQGEKKWYVQIYEKGSKGSRGRGFKGTDKR
jgi:hypothetical protein